MRSIKSKLVLIFVLVVLFMLVGLGGIFIFKVMGYIEQDTHRELINMAQMEAQYIQANVNKQLTYIDIPFCLMMV